MFTFDQQNEAQEDGGYFDGVNIETEVISTAQSSHFLSKVEQGIVIDLCYNLCLTGLTSYQVWGVMLFQLCSGTPESTVCPSALYWDYPDWYSHSCQSVTSHPLTYHHHTWDTAK